MFDPSDATGFADRLFPARLTGVLADEDGIWHYSWVEMMLGGDGILVESEGGRQGVITRESFSYQAPPGSGNYLSDYRATDPSDSAAFEVKNAFVPIPNDEAMWPVVWMRLRGFENGEVARYEFQWDAADRLAECFQRIGNYPWSPDYYSSSVRYLDQETGEWAYGGGTLVVKPANHRSVILVSQKHITVPTGRVTTEADGLPGETIWTATGTCVELVSYGNVYLIHGIAGTVHFNRALCRIAGLPGLVGLGGYTPETQVQIGVPAGVDRTDPEFDGIPVYEVASNQGILTGTWDEEHGIANSYTRAGAIFVHAPAQSAALASVDYTFHQTVLGPTWILRIGTNPPTGLSGRIDLTVPLIYGIHVTNGYITFW